MKTKRVRIKVEVIVDVPESSIHTDDIHDLCFADVLLHGNLESHLDTGVSLIFVETQHVSEVKPENEESLG